MTFSDFYDPNVTASAQSAWTWIVLRPFWWAFWASLAVGILGSAIAGGRPLRLLAIALVIIGLVMVASTVALRAVFAVVARWRTRRPGSLEPGDEMRYTFDETSVTLDTKLASNRLDWRLIRGFVVCDQCTFVQLGARTALVLPTSVVDSERFRAIIAIAPERLPIRRARRLAPSEIIKKRDASATG